MSDEHVVDFTRLGVAGRFSSAAKYIAGYGLEAMGRYYGIYPAQIVNIDEDDDALYCEMIDVIPQPQGSQSETPHVYLQTPIYYKDGMFPFISDQSGFITTPQIGDRIFIAFFHGLLERPFFVGFMANQAEDNPPTKTRMGFVSRTGMYVDFNDDVNPPTITISSDASGGQLTTIAIQRDKIAVNLPNDSTAEVDINIPSGNLVVTTKNTTITGDLIQLVKDGADQSGVRGDDLNSFLTKLLNYLLVHTHAPGSPPANASQFQQLLQILDEHLSKNVKLE